MKIARQEAQAETLVSQGELFSAGVSPLVGLAGIPNRQHPLAGRIASVNRPRGMPVTDVATGIRRPLGC